MTNWTPAAANQLGLPAPRLVTFELTGTDSITLTFTTLPGRTYSVQFSDELAPSLWQPLGPSQTAQGSTLSVGDNFPVPTRSRFYRVLVVE
jgi:hypothetical protein